MLLKTEEDVRDLKNFLDNVRKLRNTYAHNSFVVNFKEFEPIIWQKILVTAGISQDQLEKTVSLSREHQVGGTNK